MPQQPPHHPPNITHNLNRQFNHQAPNPTVQTYFPSRPTNLPDFLLTAISLILFITAPKHHRPQPLSLSYTNHPRVTRLTSTTMNPRNPRNPRNPTPFPTPQSLSDWLKPRLPSDSFSTWGTSPGTKNVHNLWLELLDGETSLVDTTPPVRNLEVVSVRVFRKGKNGGKEVLIESHQELSDGSVRRRDRPLSEKIKAGEDLVAATKRAVREELGSVIGGFEFFDNDDVVRVVMDKYERRVEERSSVSYPGLPACYVLHCVDAVVDGLPEREEFVTEEGEEYGDKGGDGGVASAAVKVKRHFWKWVPVAEDSV